MKAVKVWSFKPDCPAEGFPANLKVILEFKSYLQIIQIFIVKIQLSQIPAKKLKISSYHDISEVQNIFINRSSETVSFRSFGSLSSIVTVQVFIFPSTYLARPKLRSCIIFWKLYTIMSLRI